MEQVKRAEEDKERYEWTEGERQEGRKGKKQGERLQINYFPPEDVTPPHSPLLKGSESSCLAHLLLPAVHGLGSGNLRTSGALLLPWKPLADRIEKY